MSSIEYYYIILAFQIIKMKLSLNQLLVVFCFLFSTHLCAQKSTISGFIKDQNTGEPLIGATVYDMNTFQGTTTNNYGYYSLTLDTDSLILSVSFLGYQSKKFQIELDQDLLYDVELGRSDVAIDKVEIVGKKESSIQERSEMSTNTLDIKKIKELPVLLGERDILKTIQLLPGVQSGGEGTSGLYVRGGGPDQNLILLDGVPIYNASHLFGFFSVFNDDALNSVKLIKGGFPARYGGRLSSVIDIRMKEGNMKEFKGEGSIGLISSKLTLEGPIKKDKTSFIVSGRRTYIDLLARPFIAAAADGEGSGGYYFYDLNAKVNHIISERSRLYLSGYFGKDRFYARDQSDYTNNGVRRQEENDSEIFWGNAIGALRWNYVISQKLFLNTTVTYSDYGFNIGAKNLSQTTELGSTETDRFEFEYISGIRDLSAKLDFDFTPNPNHFIRFGAGYINHRFTPGVNTFSFESTQSEDFNENIGSDVLDASEYWLYAEDDMKLGEKLKINVGVHASGFAVDDKSYFSIQPRFTGRYLINELTSVKASFASMTQYLHLLTNAGIGLPTDLWVPPTKNIQPQDSYQVAVGLARSMKKDLDVSFEVYYKEMYDMIEYKDGASFFGFDTEESWEDKVEVGNGQAYGAEFLIEKKLGDWSGWIGYTLAWNFRSFDNINFGEKYPYRYDRRHDIGAALSYKFNENVDMGFVWVYGSGNAVTLPLETYGGFNGYFQEFAQTFGGNSINHIDSRNNYRMSAYHRLDIGINLHKETSWGERTWSFGLYNAYSRQNPFYLYFSNDSQGNERLTQLSLFPIIPSFSYQFKF